MTAITSRRAHRPARAALVAAIAIGSSAGLAVAGLGVAPAATAAASGYVATPNGMVGVSQTVIVSAPKLKGQVVAIGFTSGAASFTQQTTLGATGIGSVTWTPTTPGSWTIAGLGNAISAGSTTVSVAAMPTETTLIAPNNVQRQVPGVLNVIVSATLGSIPPAGTVSISSAFGYPVGTAALVPNPGTTSALAQVSWTPEPIGPFPIIATYVPASGAYTASTSGTAQPNVVGDNPTVSLQFAPVLRLGQPTLLTAVLGAGVPDGSAAFIVDTTTIGGSVPTTNGIAYQHWTPGKLGNQMITVQFSTGAPKNVSGTSSQAVSVQPGLPLDTVVVDPVGQAPWSVGSPIVMKAGTSVTLAATAASGATVIFSETGPCIISGAVLKALAAGQCQVTVVSPGSAAYDNSSATYTIAVTAPPKKG
jgi:hypothetical protein